MLLVMPVELGCVPLQTYIKANPSPSRVIQFVAKMHCGSMMRHYSGDFVFHGKEDFVDTQNT